MFNAFSRTRHSSSRNLTSTSLLTEDAFLFSGHVHPGIQMRGIGKQSLRFPCFYFTQNQCILPAFSKFSGLAIVKPKKQDQVYAIANDNIIKLA